MTPTALPFATEPTQAPPDLALQRGSFDEEAPFAGVFVLDLNARTWLHIDEDPSRAPEPWPRLLAAFAPGDLLAIATSADDVRIVDFEGNEVRSWPDLRAFSGAFSPDGRFLGLGTSSVAAILNVETGEVINLDIDQGVWDVDWSPDGERLLLGTGGGRGPMVDGKIYVYWIVSRELELLSAGLYPRWSPDGGRIAFIENGVLKVVALDGTLITSWLPDGDTLTGFWWSPDGTQLIAGLITFFDDPRTSRAAVIGSTTGRLQFSVTGTGGLGSSPDGAWFVASGNVCSSDETLFLLRPDGSDLHPVIGRVFGSAWSPDSSEMVAGVEEGLMIFPLDGGSPKSLITGPLILQRLQWHEGDTITFYALSVAGFCEGSAPQTTEVVFPNGGQP